MSSALVVTPSSLEYQVRQSEPGDTAFVMKTWKMRIAKTPAYNWAGWGKTVHALDATCGKIFDRLGAVIACNPNRPSHILAFAVKDLSQNVCHFVYVHEAYRRQGLARTLLAGLNFPLKVSFWTPECSALGERYHLVYVPALRSKE